MNTFFRKENAFNVIFFGIIVILAVFKNKENLLCISPILSCLIFALSILSIVISVLEKIIHNYSEDIVSIMQSDGFGSIYEIYYPNKLLEYAFKCKYKNGLIKLKSCFFPDEYIARDTFETYLKYHSRKKLRIIRKILLAIHYLIIFLTLALLILMEELIPFLSGFRINDFTIWSLVIVLLQVLLGDIITKVIFDFLDKKHKKKTDLIISGSFKIKKQSENIYQIKSSELLDIEQQNAFENLWEFIDKTFDKKEQALLLFLARNYNQKCINMEINSFSQKVLENDKYFYIDSKENNNVNFGFIVYFGSILLFSINTYFKISRIPIEELETTDFSELYVVE